MAQNGLCRERHLPLQHAVIRHPLQPALITCASHCGAGFQPCKKIVILPDLPVFHAQRDIPQTQLLQAFLRKAGLFPQLPQSTGPRVVQFGLLKMAAYAAPGRRYHAGADPVQHQQFPLPEKVYRSHIPQLLSHGVSLRPAHCCTPMFPV